MTNKDHIVKHHFIFHIPLLVDHFSLLLKDKLRYNFERKPIYTREEEDNDFANKTDTFDEELEKETCFEDERLLPCNKATQTSLSEENSKEDLDYFDKEDYSTRMENSLQTKISTAVQTDALFCSKCECLVCDLVNDIDGKDKQSDFGGTQEKDNVDSPNPKEAQKEASHLNTLGNERCLVRGNSTKFKIASEQPQPLLVKTKPRYRNPSGPIDLKHTSDWTDSLEYERETTVEMPASNGECVDAPKVHENAQSEIEKNLVQASWGVTGENGDDRDVAMDIGHDTSSLEDMTYGRSNPLAAREEMGNSQKNFMLSPCVIQTRSRTANLRKESRNPSGN